MTQKKFLEDCFTLHEFIQCYCDNEHAEEKKSIGEIDLVYHEKSLGTKLNYKLCNHCKSMFEYSYNRLQECPKDNKPRCRKCSTPCYDKPAWKKLSKVMRYSGMRLGFVKIKNFFTPPQ